MGKSRRSEWENSIRTDPKYVLDSVPAIPQAENAGIPDAQPVDPQMSSTGFSGLDFLKDVGGVVYNAGADFNHPIIGAGVALDAFQKGVIGGIGSMIENLTTGAVVADFKRNYIDGESPFRNLTYNIYKDMMNKVNARKVATPANGTTLSYGQETAPTATNPGNPSSSENQRAIEDSFVNLQMKNRASGGDDTYSHGKDGKNYSLVGGALLDMSDSISKMIDAPEKGFELFRGFGNMASFAAGSITKGIVGKLGRKMHSKVAQSMGTGIMIGAEADGYLDEVVKERGVAALGDPVVMSSALGVGIANAIIEKRFGFDPTNMAAKAAMKASIKDGAMEILEKGVSRETLGQVGKTAGRMAAEAAGTAVSEGTQEVLQSLVGQFTKYGITSMYGEGVVDNPLSEKDTRQLIHEYATDFAIGGMIGGIMNTAGNLADGKEDRNAAYDYIRNGTSSFNPESAGGYVADKVRDIKDFFKNTDAGNSPADIQRRADKVKAAMANKVQSDWEYIQNSAGITEEQRIQLLEDAKRKYEQGAAAIDNLANLAINIPSRVGEVGSFQAYEILEKQKALKDLIKADETQLADQDLNNAVSNLNQSDIKAREELLKIYDSQLQEIGEKGFTKTNEREQQLLRDVGLSEYAQPLLDKKDSIVDGVVDNGLVLNDETSFVSPNGTVFAKDGDQWVALEKVSEARVDKVKDDITGLETKVPVPARYRVKKQELGQEAQDIIQKSYEASGSAKRVQGAIDAETKRVEDERLASEQAAAKAELDLAQAAKDELVKKEKDAKAAHTEVIREKARLDAKIKEEKLKQAQLDTEIKELKKFGQDPDSKMKEFKALEDSIRKDEESAAKVKTQEARTLAVWQKSEEDTAANAQKLDDNVKLAQEKLDKAKEEVRLAQEKVRTQEARTERVKSGTKSEQSTVEQALADKEFKAFFDKLEPHIMYGLQPQDVPWNSVSDISLDANDQTGDRARVEIPGFGWQYIPFELVGDDKVFKYYIAKGVYKYADVDVLYFPLGEEIMAVTPEGEVDINKRQAGVRIRVSKSSLDDNGNQTGTKSPDLEKRKGIVSGIKKAFSGQKPAKAVVEAIELMYNNFKNGLVALNIGDVAHIANFMANQGEVWSGELDARFVDLFNLGMDLGSTQKEAAFAKLAREMGMEVGNMVSDIAFSNELDKAQAVRDIVIKQAFKDGLLTDVKIRELKNRQLNEKPTIVDGTDTGAESARGKDSQGANQEVQSGKSSETKGETNGEGAAVAEKQGPETSRSAESGAGNASETETRKTDSAEATKNNDVEEENQGDTRTGAKESEDAKTIPEKVQGYDKSKFNGNINSIEKGDIVEYDGEAWEVLSNNGKTAKVRQVSNVANFANIEAEDITAIYTIKENYDSGVSYGEVDATYQERKNAQFSAAQQEETAQNVSKIKKLAEKMAAKFKGSKIKYFTDKDRNIDGIKLKIGEKVWGIKASDGTIYLNLDGISFESAIHEFSHLWEAIYPSKFLEGVTLLKSTDQGQKLFDELRANKSYENLDDNQIWREALNTAIGRKGKDLYKGTMLMRFKEYLKSLFNGIGERLGIKISPDTKLKDFLNLAVKDVTNNKTKTNDKRETVSERLREEEERGGNKGGKVNDGKSGVDGEVSRTIENVQFNAAMAFGDGRFESGTEVDLGFDSDLNQIEQLIATDWEDMLDKDKFDNLFDNFVGNVNQDAYWKELIGNEDLRELLRAEIIDRSKLEDVQADVEAAGAKYSKDVGKIIHETAAAIRKNTFFAEQVQKMSPNVYWDEITNKFYKIDETKEKSLIKKSGFKVGLLGKFLGSHKQLDTILIGMQEYGGFLSKVRVMMQGSPKTRAGNIKNTLKPLMMDLINKYPELTNQTLGKPVKFGNNELNLSEAFSLYVQDARVQRETGKRHLRDGVTILNANGKKVMIEDYQEFVDALEKSMDGKLAEAKKDFEAFFTNRVAKDNIRMGMLVTQGVSDFKVGVPIIKSPEQKKIFISVKFDTGRPLATADVKFTGDEMMEAIPMNEIIPNHVTQMETFAETAEYSHHIAKWNNKYKDEYKFEDPSVDAGVLKKTYDKLDQLIFGNSYKGALESRMKEPGGNASEMKGIKWMQRFGGILARKVFAGNLVAGMIQSLGIINLAAAPMRTSSLNVAKEYFGKSLSSTTPIVDALLNVKNFRKFNEMTAHDMEAYLSQTWLPINKWAKSAREMKEHSPYLYSRLNNSFFEINELLRDSSGLRGKQKDTWDKFEENLTKLGRNLSLNQTIGDIGVIIAEWEMSKKEHFGKGITTTYNGETINMTGWDAVNFAASANVQYTQVVHDIDQITNIKRSAQKGNTMAALYVALFPFITENIKRMNMVVQSAMITEPPIGNTQAQWNMKRSIGLATSLTIGTLTYRIISGLWSSLKFNCGTEKFDETMDKVLSTPVTYTQGYDLITSITGNTPALAQGAFLVKKQQDRVIKKYGEDASDKQLKVNLGEVVGDMVTLGNASKVDRFMNGLLKDEENYTTEDKLKIAAAGVYVAAGVPSAFEALVDCFTSK